MRGTSRGRARESFNPRPPPATPLDHFRLQRDSDASFASSRPSSVGMGPTTAALDLYKDRSFQQSTVSAVNSYLSSHSLQFSLKFPIPSAREITETLKFLLARLDYPSPKLEDDLPLLLKFLKCPFKPNKSLLRNPTVNAHQWPTLLAVIHWIFQIVLYTDHLAADSRAFVENNAMSEYALESYLHYIHGNDDAVEALDRDFLDKLDREKENAEENVRVLEATATQLQGRVETMRLEPSRREALEKERGLLEGDVVKFNEIIGNLEKSIANLEAVLEGREKELEAKVVDNKRIFQENAELNKRVELQTFNARDVDRMKRELQAVERDIGEAELERNAWEEKAWEIDTMLSHKFKDLEAVAMDCNQAMRRLKLGNGFQYLLNAKGSTPAEIMGIDYKSTLKPALDSYSEDIKKSSVEKLEELISLQKQSSELSAQIEGKRNFIATLQSHIGEVEAQLNLLKKEIQEYTSRCAAEARNLMEDVERETRNLDIVEREANEILKTSKLKLQDAIKQTEEETQMCAYGLMAVIDSVSKYKEYVQSKIFEMKKDVSETAVAVSDTHKSCLQSQFGFLSDANQQSETALQ
ncbi:kinetochore protein NDC80 homolog [Pyrus x bretschneideri]|uniref:kinetochore protein NDC80 homolog n=1 Tax=Pyrus x bretschneideri TaxID=225117 RepID=UPI0020300D17|nr:kinetochore protein NDC80 homolog [Pyrus x bretschneideri]